MCVCAAGLPGVDLYGSSGVSPVYGQMHAAMQQQQQQAGIIPAHPHAAAAAAALMMAGGNAHGMAALDGRSLAQDIHAA
jgi:hypothetical protein